MSDQENQAQEETQLAGSQQGTDTVFTDNEWTPVPGKRGRPTKKSASAQSDLGWECDQCKVVFTDKKSKLVACEYCEVKRCTKCLKISDTAYKSIGGRDDFPWFCNGCVGKALRCIKEERDIEARCNKFLEGYKKEVDTRFLRLEKDVKDIQEHLKGDTTKDNTASASKETVVKEACHNIADSLAREKNIIVFNIGEKAGTLEENVASDKADIQELNRITAGITDLDMTVRRLGKKGASAKPRPVMVSYSNVDNKTSVMRNLNKLKNAKPPLDKISIRNDLSREDREKEKKLQEEAKEMNDSVSRDPNFVFVVRGMPWDRKIIKVKKKVDKTAKEPVDRPISTEGEATGN